MSIQGQTLEITVVGCTRLRDTEWISKQDPYVCLDYAGNHFRTRTCVDGHTDPIYQQGTTFHLIEGCREIELSVWNSNTFSRDNLIGKGRVLLQKVLSEGSDESAWTIGYKKGRFAGEVQLRMRYSGAPLWGVPPPQPLAAAPAPPAAYGAAMPVHPQRPADHAHPAYALQRWDTMPAGGYYGCPPSPYHPPQAPYPPQAPPPPPGVHRYAAYPPPPY